MSSGLKVRPKKSSDKPDVMKMAVQYVKPIMSAITTVIPIVIDYSQKLWGIYESLPEDQLQAILGFVLCFFGGLYPVLFAAMEAAKHGGMETLVTALKELSEEAMVIIEENKKDDDVDADNDGTKDVDQLNNRQLIMRKFNLVIVKMNPEKMNHAFSCVYKVWLSVIAVLAHKFAKTIALACSISDFVRKPVQKYCVSIIQTVVPDQYKKWVPTLCTWFITSVAMSFAYFLQSIITAFTSSLTGSVMLASALLRIARKKGLKFVPKDLKDTYIDEVLAYGFAIAGFSFQFKLGFDVSFPFNILLFPFEIFELVLRWSITYQEV